MDDVTSVDNSNLATAGVEQEARRTLSRKPDTKMYVRFTNFCLKKQEGGQEERKKKCVFSVEFLRSTYIRIRILSTLKLYDKGDMVSFFFQGSDKGLSKKWARTRANGPGKAGQVRKRTREQTRKRAKTRPRSESSQVEYGTVLKGAKKCKVFLL